jgi:hypothetical protein
MGKNNNKMVTTGSSINGSALRSQRSALSTIWGIAYYLLSLKLRWELDTISFYLPFKNFFDLTLLKYIIDSVCYKSRHESILYKLK